MQILPYAKQLSILLGAYSSARWLYRHLRPGHLRAYRNAVRFYENILPPSALCFDIGANIGEKSEAMLRAGAQVIAFEPSPEALPELRARCRQYGNWQLVIAALGSSPGVKKLYCSRDSARASLDENWNRDVRRVCYVPVLTLDLAIEAFGKPYYCKIDVEGWEMEVLRGLNQPIPLLSLEFHLWESEIKKTLSCLEHLAGYGDSYANIAAAESSNLIFPDWLPLREFKEWFPGDLPDRLAGDLYGDIFIRNSLRN